MTAAPIADLTPPDISEAWLRYLLPITLVEDVSAHSYYLPDAVVHFGRDDHGYFARAEFTHNRGAREVSRGTLENVLAKIGDWRRNGLSVGPYHMPEGAYQWTNYEDGSLRATTPLGEARILPFVGDLFILVLVPDDALCVLVEGRIIEELKRLAYDHAVVPRAAIRISGFRYDFRASSRPGEIAQVEVHGVKYVLVPHMTESGVACVAVEAVLPSSARAADLPLVQRLAVHRLVDLEFLEVLWSNEDDGSHSAWSTPWPHSAPQEASNARSTESAPKPGDAGARASSAGEDGRPGGARTASTTRVAAKLGGARATASAARNPPDGVDPLAWEGFVLQAEHAASLTFDPRLGRRVFVQPMRAQCSEALIAAARACRSLHGAGVVLRRQLEHHAGVRLQGSQSAFKEWMRVVMNHTSLGHQIGRYVREFPLADLWVQDSEYCQQLRAYALAARPDPPPGSATSREPVVGEDDVDRGATGPALGEPAPRRPAPGHFHAVLVMDGERIVASRFRVPSDDTEAVIRELTATAGPYTRVTLDGREVEFVDLPEPTAAPTEGGHGHEPRDQPASAASSTPSDTAPPPDTSRPTTGTATSAVPSPASTSGAQASAAQGAQRPPHVGSPAHRPGQYPQPDVTRSPGERERTPAIRSRDGPPVRRFREADLNEDLSKDPWTPK